MSKISINSKCTGRWMQGGRSNLGKMEVGNLRVIYIRSIR